MIGKPFLPFGMARSPFDRVAEQVCPGFGLNVVMDADTDRGLGSLREPPRSR